MKHLVTLLLAILISTSWTYGQTEDDKEKASAYGMEAIKLMDEEGKFKESIDLLKKAKKLDPDRIIYTYEIAYALYSQGQYKKAVKEMKKIISHKDVSDQYFQMLGNSYDNAGMPEEALKAYKQGLERFPNSGKLYVEQGILEYIRGNYDTAIDYWEKGIEVEPTFASNYYWLGKIYSFSDERIWSVLYGEAFINLERNSKRTTEMSKILFDTYKASIKVTSDTSAAVSFSKQMLVNPSLEFEMPFTMSYEMTMAVAMPMDAMSNDFEISISYLNALRQNFIAGWFQQEKEDDHPNLLFDFHRELREQEFFESYNYWFLMMGNEEEFENWLETNEAKYDEFINWFSDNPLTMNEENYFSRRKY